MEKFKVIDKVSWHYPEGNNCPNLEIAKSIFIAIMNWLKSNRLLTDEGEEIFDIGIGSEFSLTSAMLTDRGNEILAVHYSKWLQTLKYDEDINTRYFNSVL